MGEWKAISFSCRLIDRWQDEFGRFWSVFPRVEGVRILTSIPGNHDIGLGNGIQPQRLERFKTYFAGGNSTSQYLSIGKFDLVLLDTPSLLNSASTNVSEPPNVFLEDMIELERGHTRLLFTHIPLYRSPEMGCGSDRESSRPIREGGGYQYQNMLSEELTMHILDSLWPVSAIFSGDDHDYCLAEHEFEGRREVIPEYTVKSFSWAMVPPSMILLIVGNTIPWISTHFTRTTTIGRWTTTIWNKTVSPPITNRWIRIIRDHGHHLISINWVHSLWGQTSKTLYWNRKFGKNRDNGE